MYEYTVFNMIKNYNKSVEDPKDSGKNGYEGILTVDVISRKIRIMEQKDIVKNPK